MADPVMERQKSPLSHTQQHARPSQSPTRTRLLMMLTCLVAVGIAVAVGPLPIGPNGDLVVSSVMMAAACASRRDHHAPKKEGVYCGWIRRSTFKSTRPFLSLKPSLQNHPKSSKDCVVTNSRGAGLLTAETKPKSPVFYVTGRMVWVSAV